jgi:hypothetical protein
VRSHWGIRRNYKKSNAWAADAIAERNRWRETIWQKVKDCEAAKPFVQRAALGVTENWSYLRSSLQFILLPPLAVLFAGVIFGWIVVRGSRAKQHELVLRRDFFSMK